MHFPLRSALVLAALAAATVSSISGCAARSATTAEPAAGRLVDQKTVDAEYSKKIAALTFPASYKAPSAMPHPVEKTSYESGYGTGLAERQWICAWEKEWLAAAPGRDTARTASALATLERAPATLFMSKQLDDAGRRLFADDLTKAKLGDPGGIQGDVDQNCTP